MTSVPASHSNRHFTAMTCCSMAQTVQYMGPLMDLVERTLFDKTACSSNVTCSKGQVNWRVSAGSFEVLLQKEFVAREEP